MSISEARPPMEEQYYAIWCAAQELNSELFNARIDALIEAVKTEERERCARVCEGEKFEDYSLDYNDDYNQGCKACAKACISIV